MWVGLDVRGSQKDGMEGMKEEVLESADVGSSQETRESGREACAL